MTFRQTTDPPFVLSLKRLVIGLDPETGRERWRHTLEAPAGRMFLVEQRLFVTYGWDETASVACLDYATGVLQGRVLLGFFVTAGFVRGERLFVGGPKGAACLTLEGLVLWSARCTPHGIGPLRVGDAETLTARDAQGGTLWSAEIVGDDERAHDIGLLCEGHVAQPDL